MKTKDPKDFGKARDYAYRLLSYRPRSKKEIIDRLTRRGFSGETIGSVVDYLSRLNYINDSQFARVWIESRILVKPMGISLLRQELRIKGINNDIIEEAIAALNRNYDEYEVAKKLFLSRWPRYSQLARVTSLRRIHAYLKRRGFDSEIISKIMQEETGR